MTSLCFFLPPPPAPSVSLLKVCPIFSEGVEPGGVQPASIPARLPSCFADVLSGGTHIAAACLQ